MKKFVSSLSLIISFILVLGFYSFEAEASFSKEDYFASALLSAKNKVPAIPDPARILDSPDVEIDREVDLEYNGDIYVFDLYTYTFNAPKNLTDNKYLMTYQMLCTADDIELDLLYSKNTYSEYALAWNGTDLIGFLCVDRGVWSLYVPESIGLNSKKNDSKTDNSKISSSAKTGGFLNESFGIKINPWDIDNSTSSASGGHSLCDACNGSGRCDGCGGDGWFDNPYLGEKNTKKCSLCDKTGKCSVCDGTGVW